MSRRRPFTAGRREIEDHGEALHGNLLYQGVMRVPLVILGPEISAARVERLVSTRRIFDTILSLAGGDPVVGSLLGDAPDMVLAEAIKPYLQHYLAMHHFRFRPWKDAEPLFEIVLSATPDRLPALECLAQIREQQGRIQEASSLLEHITTLKSDPQVELVKLGEMRMSVGDTQGSI